MNRSAAVVLIVAFLALAYDTQKGIYMNGVDQDAPLLAEALGRLAPVSRARITVAPDSRLPRFCWKFERPHPAAFAFLRRALAEFDGEFSWIVMSVSDRETCLVPMPRVRMAFYTPRRGVTAPITPATPERLRSAFDDLQRLPDFLLTWFEQHKPPLSTADNYLEPGVHSVWIIDDPRKFQQEITEGVTTQQGELPFGLSLSELSSIFSEITEHTGTFTFLTRIKDPWDDAWYLPEEIAPLKEETQRAERILTQPESLAGLKKLGQICDLAVNKRSGIYFLAR